MKYEDFMDTREKLGQLLFRLLVSFSPLVLMMLLCSTQGSADFTIRLWKTNSEEEFLQLIGHKNTIWCVVFSPSGELLASGLRDKAKISFIGQNYKTVGL